MSSQIREMLVLITLGIVGVFVLAACTVPGGLSVGQSQVVGEAPTEPVAVETEPIPEPDSEVGTRARADEQVQGEGDEAASSTTAEEPTILTVDDRPNRLKSATASWNTDWTRHTIDYGELLSGGPPRDGIPSIDNPQFISSNEAAAWLADNEPVIALEIEGVARAYPLQILTWHEIVNDVVADVPVALTFAREGGKIVDEQTGSTWNIAGQAVEGPLVGQQLTPIVHGDHFWFSWAAFKPDTLIYSG